MSQPTSQTRIVAGAHSNLLRKMAAQPIFVGLCRALLDRESEAAKSGDFVLFALCRPLPRVAGHGCIQRARKRQPVDHDFGRRPGRLISMTSRPVALATAS